MSMDGYTEEQLNLLGEADRVPKVDPGLGFGISFGYRWKDSDASGGPRFDWVDIAFTGTMISFGGNNRISYAGYTTSSKHRSARSTSPMM